MKTNFDIKDLARNFLSLTNMEGRQEYELFKLYWMMTHGYTLQNLVNELTILQWEDLENIDITTTPVNELLIEFEKTRGFGLFKEIYPTFEEWKKIKNTLSVEKNV